MKSKSVFCWLFLINAAFLFYPITSLANDYDARLKAHLENTAIKWIQNPIVIRAIKTQNTESESISSAQINKLDKEWKTAVNGGDSTLVKNKLNNELSNYLKNVKRQHSLYTEIFVMDNKGLNVGQSDITSDYWQGDESKWTDTYSKGPNSIHISEVEEDESTGVFQTQLSVTIVDPDTQQAIGAITMGINVDELE